MTEVDIKYGFPLFTTEKSTQYLVKNNNLRVSDIWAFWNFIVQEYAQKKGTKETKNLLLSLLEQAKYFYVAAESAPIKSQPLLYYYSFLNIGKIILIMDNINVQNMNFHHGVKTEVTRTTTLSNAEIKLQALNGNTRNLVPVDYQLMKIVGDTLPEKAQGSDYWEKYKIKDLLQSCVSIHRTFCATENEKENFIRIKSSHIQKQGKKLYYKGVVDSSDLIDDILINRYSLVFDSEKNEYYFMCDIDMKSNRPTQHDYYELAKTVKQKGLWYYTCGDEYRLFISSKAQNISPESIIYNIMFFLGSITRYHPDLFDKLLTERELWLMSEFLSTQPTQFLFEVTSKVLGDYVYSSNTKYL